jgi:glycosyltransferase involved in cell wall biosynthesis
MEARRLALLIPLTVRPEDDAAAQRGEGPRKDYFELARATGGRLVDNGVVQADRDPVVRAAWRRAGPALSHALWAFRHRAELDLVYADSERVGLPLAALLQTVGAPTRQVMIAHWLSPWKKRAPLRLLRLHRHLDRIICHIELQRQVALRAGAPPAQVRVVPYGVDHQFWRPQPTGTLAGLCSVGMEQRDYSTLINALRGLNYPTVIAAASPWFSHGGVGTRAALPSTITLGKFNYRELRDLYARSRFVVVPLLDRDFQAGVTTILEAMAMGKAVVVTRTRGQQGASAVRDGENGLSVPPGDARALREAIGFLWEHPD